MTHSEWEGEPHVLTVRSITPPVTQFDDGSLDYDLEHPASCKQEQRGEGEHSRMAWACEAAWAENEIGVASSLRYSGTPVTEPGTYRIRSWGRKDYIWDAGAYEYDGGIVLIGDDE